MSQTIATSKTKSDRCPDWCKYTIEQHLEYDGNEPWLHAGFRNPTGWFDFWQTEGQPTIAAISDIQGRESNLTAADLRELAASALEAAEQLDAIEAARR